ncbi:Anaerobic nitric oxide reductase transcription regulator NorR [subsurface metagenome]
MDKNEFFRQSTLRICGNLEIEEAMQACLQFLRQVMPVDRMFLQRYDYGFNAMRTIAEATLSECHKLDTLTPLSEEASISAQRENLPELTGVYIFEDPEKYAVSREMLQFHSVPCTSLMVMLLKSKDQILGSLVLITEGKERYIEEHARLLFLLKEPFVIALSNTLKHREVLKLKDLLADDNRYLHGELRRLSGDEIVGANFGLKDAMDRVRQVAALDSPVLLLGETGVGKDMIANAIHYSSTRRDGPFINVNCGAIPETLIDSELFGHEKGAFTGALSQKRGRFERADKGTILLDEIGELPPQAQVRLLRVLQDKEIERVGGTKTIPLDIRIIAASNRNLEEMVKTNQFREDLWFRINVFPIWILPLRERKSDIPALLQHFISLKAKELKLPAIPTLSPVAIDPLMQYHWPGNIRELQNVVERILILNPDGPLTFEHLNLPQQQKTSDLPEQAIEPDNLDEVISRHIRQVLSKTNGKIHGPGGAAELLGINPSTLRNRMNKLGIDYGRGSRD